MKRGQFKDCIRNAKWLFIFMNHVSMFMDADHQYLVRLLDEVIAEKIDSQRAKNIFAIFSIHLEKHILLEDQILFPRFDEYIGVKKGMGPSVIAKRDHENILKLLDQVKQAFENYNLQKIHYAGHHLYRALTKHHEREGQIQYPLSNKFIPEDEWKSILFTIYGVKIYSILPTLQ